MFQPNQQALIVQDPSAMSYNGQNDSSNIAKDGEENGAYCQAESVIYSAKKLENDMQTLGRRIKQHEENIKFVKTHKNSLDDSILDMQVTLGKYHSASAPVTEGKDISHVRSEEETVEQILRHEKSAAGILCQLKTRHSTQAIPLTKEVLGIVATLGKINDDNLSRLLSEYLGLESMLAVVCTTYDAVKALETYDIEGSVSKGSGLHGLGASIGRPLDGRFLVICLEDLRPYVGEFVADDSQRRLDLLKPKLPSGESPPGFLGFAVNMIHVDSSNLFCLTTSGHGLRETLFYHLFSHLQVYRTRAEMLQARPCISHGAVSMDGGMIRSTAVFSLGSRGDVGVKFPISSGASYLPENYAEIENQLKEMKWKKERMIEDMQREEQILGHVRYNFELKKLEFLQSLAQSSPYPAQNSPYPIQMENKRKNQIAESETVGKKVKVSTKGGESDLLTKCRPQGLVEVVREMSKKQKEDVEDIGFGGLLKMQVTYLPTNMLGWLVKRFNGMSRILKIDETKKFVITSDDICDIFLLPRNSGRNVMVLKKNESRDMVVDFKKRCGIDGNASVSFLKNLLLDDFKEGGADFKRLFVLYSLSSFLTPSANYTVDFSCLKSLVDVDAISQLDWCSFVLDRLCKATCKFNNNSTTNVSGCVLALQIVYFHRLKWKGKAEPSSLPLIQHWTTQNIRNRIKEERSAGEFGQGEWVNTYPISATISVVHEEI